MQTDSSGQGGNIQITQGGVKVHAVLTFFRALAAQSVAVMWESVRTSEKLRKAAFGIQRPIAFFSMLFSPHPKSEWFKACMEL